MLLLMYACVWQPSGEWDDQSDAVKDLAGGGLLAGGKGGAHPGGGAKASFGQGVQPDVRLGF